MTTDDAEVWRDRVLRAAGGQPTESTSARLARGARARDEYARTASDQLKLRLAAESALEDVERENERMRGEIGRLRTETDRLTAQLANAARSSWIVARDGDRHCERCEQEVRRGEAYELEPGSGGLLVHVHCPDPRR